MNRIEKEFQNKGSVEITTSKWWTILLGALFSVYGFSALVSSGFSFDSLYAWGAVFLGFLFLFWGIKDFLNKQPVLTLDANGIKNHEPNLYDFETLKWLDIKSVETEKRNKDQYLIIGTRQGESLKLKMDYVSVSAKVLERIIKQKSGII